MKIFSNFFPTNVENLHQYFNHHVCMSLTIQHFITVPQQRFYIAPFFKHFTQVFMNEINNFKNFCTRGSFLKNPIF